MTAEWPLFVGGGYGVRMYSTSHILLLVLHGWQSMTFYLSIAWNTSLGNSGTKGQPSTWFIELHRPHRDKWRVADHLEKATWRVHLLQAHRMERHWVTTSMHGIYALVHLYPKSWTCHMRPFHLPNSLIMVACSLGHGSSASVKPWSYLYHWCRVIFFQVCLACINR